MTQHLRLTHDRAVLQDRQLSFGFREAAIIRSVSPFFGGYVVLIGSLCTTESHEIGLTLGFENLFSFCSQIPVLLVISVCEQKMTTAVSAPKQARILDPTKIHQQSYPQAGGGLFAFGQQQKIARGQR